MRKKDYLFKIANTFKKLSKNPVDILNRSDRDDIEEMDFHIIISALLGMFSISTSYFESVISLCKNGYGQNSMGIVRTQLESLMIFLYFIEPFDELKEIENRIIKYSDWVTIKQFNNSNKSSDFFLIKVIDKYNDYLKKVKDNYELVQQKYSNNKNEFNRLANSTSFIKNKLLLADKFEIKDLYNHIQSECSATIHLSDAYDRIIYEEEDDLVGYSFNVHMNNTLWPLSLSNFVQFHLLINFGEFFQVKDYMKTQLRKVLKKT